MNFLTICRICIEENSEMTSIFESYNFSEHNCEIFKVITDCASVQIQKFDGFSEQICSKCLNHLSQAYSFKKLCEDSYYKFQNNFIYNEKIEMKDEITIEDTTIRYVDYDYDQYGIGKEEPDSISDVSESMEYQELSGLKDMESNENAIEPFEDEIIIQNNSDYRVTKEELECIENDTNGTSNSSSKFELNNKSLTTSLVLSKEVDTNQQQSNICDETNLETHPEETPYKYDKKITHKPNLSNSTSLYEKENSYNCNICSKIFTRKKNLENHIKVHLLVINYKCEICDKSFSQSSHLTCHIRTHTGEKLFKCDYCDKAFSRKDSLKIHIKVHTGEKAYKCEICEKCYLTKRNLTKHIMVHTGEKPYKCEFCEKKFTQQGSLVIHTRMHKGEKPYKCELCDKCFRRNYDLVTHVKIHTGENPYKCKLCDKGYSRKGHLVDHVKTHTGEKPYKCDLCDKYFFTKCNLTRHIRVHTGEKPYSCSICDKPFSQTGNLAKHVRLHKVQEEKR